MATRSRRPAVKAVIPPQPVAEAQVQDVPPAVEPAAAVAAASAVEAAAEPAAKPASRGTKAASAVKPAPKKAARKKAASAAKPAKAPKSASAQSKPAKAASAARKPAKEVKDKPTKLKVVRDSFTIPKAEYAVLQALKERALRAGHAAKKSELLRAGLQVLAAMPDDGFLGAVKTVEPLKTGRPAKD